MDEEVILELSEEELVDYVNALLDRIRELEKTREHLEREILELRYRVRTGKWPGPASLRRYYDQ